MNQNIILRQEDTDMNIVNNNPFRILGVFANSPKRDIVANKGKATAFLKVNRPVEYSLDLKGLLPSLSRTLDMMNDAEAHLAIAKEQIKYAQFWFMKATPIDDIAFNHLIAGNIDDAKEMWSKQESVSSLQNKIVCYLIENKPWVAIKTAEKLYDKFGDIYIDKIEANSTLKMSGTELLHLFIDSLGEEISMQKLLGYEMGADTKAYISSQTVEPLINKISSEVEKTKKVDHKDSKARIDAARKLVVSTKEPFTQLKSILPSSDSQFQMIADKLGLEILQCGIDYFNNSEDDDAPHTAMKMQKYAQSIVVGTLAKQRCEENVKILQKLIDELPPREIVYEYNSLMELIANFVNPPKKETAEGVTILKTPRYLSSLFDDVVGPHLPDNSKDIIDFINQIRPLVVSMKEKIGSNESHYIEICSLIGNVAIAKSVESLNKAQEVLNEWGEKAQRAVTDIYNSRSRNAISHYNSLLSSFKTMVANTWDALQLIGLMDVSAEFRSNRLNPNKDALRSIAASINVSLSKQAKDLTFFYTEEDRYKACKSYGDYSSFVERFPNGKFKSKAIDKMIAFEKSEFDKCVSISSFREFVMKYPKSSFVKNAKYEIVRLEFSGCKKYKDYIEFLKKYPNGIYSPKAKEKLDAIEKEIDRSLNTISTVTDCCALYRKYDADPGGKIDKKAYSLCNSYADLSEYIKTFTSFKADAQKRIDEIERRRVIIGVAIAAAVIILIIILANSN